MCGIKGGSIVTAVLLASVLTAASAVAGGNLRYSISVGKFDNEAGWSGAWNIGDGFATMMTAALNDSKQFIVLGDKEMRDMAMGEQDQATTGRMAGGKKAPETGQMTPAQLLVRGSVTHVQDDTGGSEGGLNFKGIRVGGKKDSAEVNITIYLVDTETGQVKASTKVVGQSSKKGLNVGYFGSALGGLTGGGGGHKNDNVGKACEDALSQAVAFLVKQLETVQWEGSVVLAAADKIMVNRGTREGVEVGQEFKVGEATEVRDPDTGEVLDVSVDVVGRLKVDSVKEKVAYCKALEGADAIKKGMSVGPAD
jgi:curli biogenesis system outer membrane secretion channel CsgG